MYKRLEIISYEDISIYEKEYTSRFDSTSTFKTNLEIHPFSQREERRITTEKHRLFYVPLMEHMSLIEKIFNNSKRLRSDLLPQIIKDRLIVHQMIDEIKSTNDVEGVKSTRRELVEALHDKTKNKRFFGIVSMYKSILEEEVQIINSLGDFRAIYDKLLLDDIEESDRPDGELFRKDVIYVAGGGKKFHQGNPNEQAIRDDLEKMLIFMNSDISFVIKALVTHYFFEYIHPFYDGNGRMGRFLLSSYLARKLDLFTGLSVSEAVLQNKKKYDESFSNTSHPKNRGDVTHFIGDMLEIILQGQERMIIKVNKIVQQVEQLLDKIDSLNLSKVESELLFILGQEQLFDFKENGISNIELSEMYKEKYTRSKINSTTKNLEAKGLLIKTKSNPIVYKMNPELLVDIIA